MLMSLTYTRVGVLNGSSIAVFALLGIKPTVLIISRTVTA
jgi:hypothetical protein